MKTKNKAAKDNLERQRLDSTKQLEEKNLKINLESAANTEKDKRISGLEEKNDRLNKQLSEEIIEKQRSNDKLQKQLNAIS